MDDKTLEERFLRIEKEAMDAWRENLDRYRRLEGKIERMTEAHNREYAHNSELSTRIEWLEEECAKLRKLAAKKLPRTKPSRLRRFWNWITYKSI